MAGVARRCHHHGRGLRRGGERARDAYPGCGAAQDERGPEIVYRLELAAPSALQAMLLDLGEVDVDLHLLGDDGASCVERADRLADRTLPAGAHRVVVDSFVSGGVEHAGAYTLVLIACEPGDPDCT